MAYMEDTGNHDVRTEGMSYGMMVCVQMNKKKEFDSLWKWARTHMYVENGPNRNYFVWSCGLDGSKNADGPAPDGEEYFAMALFFGICPLGRWKWDIPLQQRGKGDIKGVCAQRRNGSSRGTYVGTNKQIDQVCAGS